MPLMKKFSEIPDPISKKRQREGEKALLRTLKEFIEELNSGQMSGARPSKKRRLGVERKNEFFFALQAEKERTKKTKFFQGKDGRFYQITYF